MSEFVAKIESMFWYLLHPKWYRKNNKVFVIKNNNIKKLKFPYFYKGFSVKFKGSNNTIILRGKNLLKRTEIKICGDNNTIDIGKNCSVHVWGCIRGDNCSLKIGDRTTVNSMVVTIFENGSKVIIGEDCQISCGVDIWCTDSHSIADFDGNLTNLGKVVKLGNHVWVGQDVKIGKNVEIADNCIVGMGAVVTKKYLEPNCVIAGNPAKIVKQKINWHREKPDDYLKHQKEMKKEDLETDNESEIMKPPK